MSSPEGSSASYRDPFGQMAKGAGWMAAGALVLTGRTIHRAMSGNSTYQKFYEAVHNGQELRPGLPAVPGAQIIELNDSIRELEGTMGENHV